jgi:4-hydroxy-2-oxovalerate aldolase
MPSKRVDVLECTLRDGSYVIDFKFTVQETRAVVSGLMGAGVKWIEVGHGLGLGGSPKYGEAAASDEEYVQAAVEGAAGKARVGCFFIPGIGTRDHLKRARSLGMDFVRVGTNATEIDRALDSITFARELGLHVSSNLMKSYVLEPGQIAQASKKAAAAGAQVVSLVDSAGGMLPDEVAPYIRAMVSSVDIDVGYHGHNNLGLANACSLTALQNGARMIDSTLQGMGRSAGNACTESMLCIYDRLGYETGVDTLRVLDLGERYIRPRLSEAGTTGIHVVSGFALFHSSFQKHVDEASAKFGIDPRMLIIEVCKVDKNNPPADLFHQTASRLAAHNSHG